MNKNWKGALCAGLLGLGMAAMVDAAPVSGQGTWETTLLGRDLDGNAATFEAYYDTELDVTWLANANVNSLMTWSTATAWAGGLDINGVTGWRLPAVNPGIVGYNVDPSTSEMAHLFYETLGNLGYYDTDGHAQSGYGLSNTGPFSNFRSGGYWSGTEYPAPGNAWYFFFNNGKQEAGSMGYRYAALAVRDGDISPVPVPAAVWLFGSALVGLVGLTRRRR